MATLQELETFWSLDDLMRANALLDMQADLTAAQMQKAKNNGRSSRTSH